MGETPKKISYASEGGISPIPPRSVWRPLVVAVLASPIVSFPIAWLLYRVVEWLTTSRRFDPVWHAWIWYITLAPCVAFGYALYIARRTIGRRHNIAVTAMAVCGGSFIALIAYMRMH